jgi:hypothetical protein
MAEGDRRDAGVHVAVSVAGIGPGRADSEGPRRRSSRLVRLRRLNDRLSARARHECNPFHRGGIKLYECGPQRHHRTPLCPASDGGEVSPPDTPSSLSSTAPPPYSTLSSPGRDNWQIQPSAASSNVRPLGGAWETCRCGCRHLGQSLDSGVAPVAVGRVGEPWRHLAAADTSR